MKVLDIFLIGTPHKGLDLGIPTVSEGLNTVVYLIGPLAPLDIVGALPFREGKQKIRLLPEYFKMVEGEFIEL